MKGYFWFLMFALCSFSWTASARSQEATIQTAVQPGDTLLGIMTDVGCTPGRFVEAMEVNKLSANQLRTLQPGSNVLIPADCAEPAPADMAKRSAEILHLGDMGQSPEGQVITSKENNQLSEENQTVTASVDVEHQNVNELPKKSQKLGATPAPTAIPNELLYHLKPWFGGFTTGAMMTLALAGLLTYRKKSTLVQSVEAIPDQVTRDRLDVREEYEVRLKCKRCGENNLKPKNLDRHDEKAHPEMRITERGARKKQRPWWRWGFAHSG